MHDKITLTLPHPFWQNKRELEFDIFHDTKIKNMTS
jgi:hypothetical protein